MSDSRNFDYLVLTPAGPPDPTLAIAGSRAGAVGVLNLEFVQDQTAALAALHRLTTYGQGRFGILLSSDSADLLHVILAQPFSGLEIIILTSTDLEQLSHLVRLVHASARRVYLVVTRLKEAEIGRLAQVDALIAKGCEAGGWVSEETAFVLLQSLCSRLDLPVFVQGGVGLHTAAACYVAGAAGVVLDNQLLLTRETPLPDAVKTRISVMDGSETLCLGASLGDTFRMYARPDLPVVEELRQCESTLVLADQPLSAKRQTWRATLRRFVDWQQFESALLAIGQDVAFAANLAQRFQTVGGVLAGLRQAVDEHCRSARQYCSLAEGAPLAQSHGTRYPIVQGPMTRVSDRAAFAAAVAQNGGLPFLALALMRASEVDTLLRETQAQLGDRPWGVGILGFVPAELRAEQMAVIRTYRPSYALIAGGRPDQARLLEADGIKTYLHVPSPGLLRLFLQEGARRFVFEGRECGGHVGPRTSFVLWESMINVLLDHLPTGYQEPACHVLFAGGIHNDLSAAMVTAMAGTLAQRHVKIGVLMGTAYLFTEEAVHTEAIVPTFQQAALACDQTVLLETGPGHATRCIPSSYVDYFEREKRQLLASGFARDALRNRLEELNVGRLRIAAKGVDRHPDWASDPTMPKLITLDSEQQRLQGMYMIGQVAALRDRTCTLAELHQEVSAGSTQRLVSLTAPVPEPEPPPPPPAAVAIVGMACILPGAANLPTFWANILNKVDAITEVPASRWDWRHYFDSNRAAQDKVYSRWGGFISDVPFDPVKYGMPPSSLSSIEPFQLLTLAVVQAALHDAGYLDRAFPRERTSVILGAGGGGADLTLGYMVRSNLPALFGDSATDLTARLKGVLPEWTEDSFAGLLMNVAAGRVANRFDLGGVNYTVDAACASSLAAVYLAVRDLEAHTSDVVVVGGVDAIQNPFAYLCFSKTQALSPSGHCRPFDAQADGIAISEGFAALVLKRLADAERDGDHIYAVIRGVGGSSDGRDRSLTAPRPEGQIRALRRAYAQAGFSPATVELIEAHGTGTVAGDQAEVQALSAFFTQAGAQRQSCAIGSVKSMIGHTKATAGVAGLLKVALALHHRVLPPTLGVTQPNPKANFPASPFYVNIESRPWLQGAAEHPRRAGVSAFGFGGTDFHVVVEEYTRSFLPLKSTVLDLWSAELLIWRNRSRAELLTSIRGLVNKLDQGAQPNLADLAYTLTMQARAVEMGGPTLAIVANSLRDLIDKLHAAQTLLQGDADRLHLPQGIHYADTPLAPDGQLAFLFPGQGSQSINMVRDLAILFPEVQVCFEQADRTLADRFAQPLSRYIFPIPVFTPEEEKQQQSQLTATNIAQPALAVTNLALLHLLRSFGIQPQMVAGHSYGEFVALHAAGCFDAETLLRLSEARGRFISEIMPNDLGAMAAVDVAPEALQTLLADPALTLANINAPQQVIISGARASVEHAVGWCTEHGLRARLLPVACAFHSPIVAPAQQRLAALLQQTPIARPRLPVFSNTTASAYPADPVAIADLLSEHLVRPVEFVREIETMYGAGARIFVEVGPRNVLCGLVDRILGDRLHLCVPLDQLGRPGLVQLLHSLAALVTEGCTVQVERLYRDRSVRRLELSALEKETNQPYYTPTTWLVNGGQARPIHANDKTRESAPLPLPIAVLDSAAVPTFPGRAYAQVSASSQVQQQVALNGYSSSNGEAAPISHGRMPLIEAHHLPHNGHRNGGDLQRSSSNLLQERLEAASERASVGSMSPLSHTADGDDAEKVMAQFQQMMQHFLQTQKSVMLAYLERRNVRTGTNAPERRETETERTTAAEVPVPSLVTEGNKVAVAPATVATNGGSGKYANGAVTIESLPLTGKGESTAPRTRQQLTDQLLEIIKERTGYPTEMLALDADLEADLGIDSIKRVEIAGTLIRALALPEGTSPDMERLTASRTLRQVIDNLEAVASDVAAHSAAAPKLTATIHAKDHARPFEVAPADVGIGRFLVQPVPATPIAHISSLASAGIVVIIDDETGIGKQLTALLEGQGLRVLRVVSHVVPSASDEGIVVGDLSHQGGVSDLVHHLHERYGFACALIHLAALRPSTGESAMTVERWRERQAHDLTSLFLLAQALQPDLERAAGAGGAAVLATTGLGGVFACDSTSSAFFPGHGSIAGFLKTLAHEWTTVRVKVVDVPMTTVSVIAHWLLTELMAADGSVEIGYKDGQRIQMELVPMQVSYADTDPPLDRNSVLLITGGARGITAEVAVRLAETYQSTLILVGRTLAPAAPEAPETAALVEPQALRRAIMEQQRQAGLSVTPAGVEEAYRRLLHEREVRQNLARLQRSGARVEYRVCDVRDTDAFRTLIDLLYQIYGRIDGVIHGAGIIEDKLVRDKQLASFQRVLSTKVDSAVVLAEKLRPETLRFLAFFSSVSGRFGNRGQGDYAAASEVLNKLAQYLDRQWPGRVVSINWGPWLKTGMVSPAVQQQFAARGVTLIPVEVGCRMMEEELRFGRKGEVEVLIGGGSESGDSAPLASPGERVGPASQPENTYEELCVEQAMPFLALRSVLSRAEHGVKVVRSLNPAYDLYLNDHRLDGRPVLPFAMALELTAEVAAAGWPELELIAVRQMRLLQGITVEGEHVVQVLACPRSTAAAPMGSTQAELTLEINIASEGDPQRVHYRALVELGMKDDQAHSTVAAGFGEAIRTLEDAGPFPMSIEDAYRKWLFHGSLFQGIEAIKAIGPGGARSILRPSSPQRCLHGNPPGAWLIDPVVVDSAFQMQVLWARLHWGVTLLPAGFAAYRWIGPLSGGSNQAEAALGRSFVGGGAEEIHHELRIRPESLAPICHADHYFFGRAGRLLGVLTDAEGVGSTALNRLARESQP